MNEHEMCQKREASLRHEIEGLNEQINQLRNERDDALSVVSELLAQARSMIKKAKK
jgi:uncharacterized coiled-coil DUF342 family protein